MAIVHDIDKWASQAKAYSIWMLFILTTMLSISGFVFFAYDVSASYQGWGKYAQTVIDAGENSIVLAAAVSLLPTLIQAAWFVAKVTGLKFISNHPIFTSITVVAALFDTALDTFKMFKGSFVSFVFALATAILVYGILSEVLVSFFTPIALTLGKNLLKNTDVSFDGIWNGEPKMQSENNQPQQPRARAQQRQRNQKENYVNSK